MAVLFPIGAEGVFPAVPRLAWDHPVAPLLREGPFGVYRSDEGLEEDLLELRASGFDVERFDAARWSRYECASYEIGDRLDLGEEELEDLDLVDVDNSSGLALGLFGFGTFRSRRAVEADKVLWDLFAGAWSQMCCGRLLVILLQMGVDEAREKIYGPCWSGMTFYDR
ncbi:MAG: hypothetical protein CSA62_01670 [Planctomycetota bacterium]|nr:MAG: hypothetical protein CSA62_01670 [Planctomycetota bacterium]